MPLTSDHKRTYSARPSKGSPVAIYDKALVPPVATRLFDSTPVLPIHSPYLDDIPAVHETVSVEEPSLVKFGTPAAYNHYAVGWSHAMNTPFQWTKQVASHFGGT